MGLYDTLIDGEKSCQVKMFDCILATYKPGDEIPNIRGAFVITFPDYARARFAVIRDGKFEKLVDELTEEEKKLPAYDKWGNSHLDVPNG